MIVELEQTPVEAVKPLYLQYAKLEEDYGLAKRAMMVYDQATKAVPANEKLSVYEIFLARVAEIYGVPKTREIYEQAIVSDGLPERDSMKIGIKNPKLEKSLGEIDCAHKIYVYTSSLVDPHSDGDFGRKGLILKYNMVTRRLTVTCFKSSVFLQNIARYA